MERSNYVATAHAQARLRYKPVIALPAQAITTIIDLWKLVTPEVVEGRGGQYFNNIVIS